MQKHLIPLFFSLLLFCNVSFAQGKFKRALIVVFENTNYAKTMQQPYFAQLSKDGALLSNFHAVTHPSQGNYIAMAAGDLHGVKNDKNVDLDVTHIGDLLEDKGLSWKVYAEEYPGNCFTGSSSGGFARKHVPFLSFTNVTSQPERCARIQDESGFDSDVSAGTLPEYAIYVPTLKNDGHDTGVSYADKWLKKKFGPLIKDANFMKDTLLVLTFDEDSGSKDNHIYTILLGGGVMSGSTSDTYYDHYSLLKLVETELSLGSLGLKDQTANDIVNVWL